MKMRCIFKKMFIVLLSMVICGSFLACFNDGATEEGGRKKVDTDTLTWSVEDGVLTISGSGPMRDYTYNSSAPWSGESFESVVIEEGITSIGDYAFFGQQ